MKGAALQGHQTLAHEFSPTINQSGFLSTVLFGAIGNVVKIWFIGLAEVGGVAIGDSALGPHPSHCSRCVKSTGKSDTHAFANGE